MEERIIDSMMGIILPVIEKAVILAAEYSKACNRSVLTAHDMQYAMKYCARYQVGVNIGSILSSDSESDDESDSELETVDEEEDDFVRYSGDDDFYNKINECYDTWEQWVPTNPSEQMLKDAVDKNMY